MRFETTLLTRPRRSGELSTTRYFIRTSTCNRTNTPSPRGTGIEKKRIFLMSFPGITHARPSPVSRLRATNCSNTGVSAMT